MQKDNLFFCVGTTTVMVAWSPRSAVMLNTWYFCLYMPDPSHSTVDTSELKRNKTAELPKVELYSSLQCCTKTFWVWLGEHTFSKFYIEDAERSGLFNALNVFHSCRLYSECHLLRWFHHIRFLQHQLGEDSLAVQHSENQTCSAGQWQVCWSRRSILVLKSKQRTQLDLFFAGIVSGCSGHGKQDSSRKAGWQSGFQSGCELCLRIQILSLPKQAPQKKKKGFFSVNVLCPRTVQSAMWHARKVDPNFVKDSSTEGSNDFQNREIASNLVVMILVLTYFLVVPINQGAVPESGQMASQETLAICFSGHGGQFPTPKKCSRQNAWSMSIQSKVLSCKDGFSEALLLFLHRGWTVPYLGLTSLPNPSHESAALKLRLRIKR